MYSFLILLKYLWYRLLGYFQVETFYKQKSKEIEDIFVPYSHPNKKPPWVKDKVMYLKIHLPHDGCRKIAIHFNKQYTHKNMTVSKSYVYRVLKENGYEILLMRKEMRNKLPYKKSKNQMWHMDLTTIDKMQILGVVDSGTRALLVLKHLPTKSTINIIIALLEAVRDYSKPQSIKSDNEIVFTSRLMRFTLWLLGIKRETTQIASPWQNGKIERLFGTMKQSFQDLVFPTVRSLEDGLKEFRFFYNHVRMHQNLGYNTPANAWDGKAVSTSKTAREIVYYRGLCGNVAGFYFRE
ncbi:MAG TPA: transposase [Sulfurospirillum arcachonense]|nr:transposase [Sulfurospirillum arcachonense]